jgi:hypothetical protein
MIKNELGNSFGRLTVIDRAENYSDGSARWLCQCSCGNTTIQTGTVLRGGAVISCGCYIKEIKTKHQLCFTKEYKSWQSAKDRCYRPKHDSYHRYGGRGITMCERWKNDFSAFFEDMGERPAGKSLERIDNNLGYYKENCKWADRFEQCNNRRSSHFVTYDGVTKTVSQWARDLNITPQAVGKRIKKYGQPVIKEKI